MTNRKAILVKLSAWKRLLAILNLNLAIVVLLFLVAPMSLASEGAGWTVMTSGTQNILTGIWGTSGKDVFAVGHGGTILHYDGAKWFPMPSGTTDDLSGIWGYSHNDIFAVGHKSTILHYDGKGWSPMTIGITNPLKNVWGVSENDVFVIGSNGAVLHYDGSGWSSMATNVPNHLNGIWGSSKSDVFVVGNDGIILHYDGRGWTQMKSKTQNHLVGVWGTSHNNVLVVGYGGIALHYDGTQWTPQFLNVRGQLYGVWGSSANDVFAVGDVGGIYNYDGNTWAPMDSGTNQLLGTVWGASAEDVFASGFNGTLLHLAGGYRPSKASDSSSTTPEKVVLTGKWAGAQLPIPVELRQGNRIIADMSISRYNMLAYFREPDGTVIGEWNKVTSAHIDHVAKTSGVYHFYFDHLYGLGTVEYNVTYTVYPGNGTVEPPPPPPPPPNGGPVDGGGGPGVDSPTWGWIIVGFIVLGILFAFVAARDRVRRKRDYEGRGAPSGERHVYHHFPTRCKRCGGTGKVKRPMMPIQRGGPGMKEQYDDCPVCGGTGVVS